jgi:hypothetical protein
MTGTVRLSVKAYDNRYGVLCKTYAFLIMNRFFKTKFEAEYLDVRYVNWDWRNCITRSVMDFFV